MVPIVVAVTSSVLFDLTEVEAIYQESGVVQYREEMALNKDVPLKPGPAFGLIKKLLSLSDQLETEAPPVEVIILSRNSATTGERIVNSVMHHGLDIHRCIFTDGHNPSRFARSFDVDLFLSSRESEVKKCVAMQIPAGLVVGSGSAGNNDCLMFSFDFDGVIADDETESVFKSSGLEEFTRNEQEKVDQPHNHGLMSGLLSKLSKLRDLDVELCNGNKHERTLRLALVTARSIGSSHRVLTTLRHLGIGFDITAYLAGTKKAPVLRELGPDFFVDDQITHLSSLDCSGVHIHLPFGVANGICNN